MNSSIKEPGRAQPRVVDVDLDFAMCLQEEPLGKVQKSPQHLSDRTHEPVKLLEPVKLP